MRDGFPDQVCHFPVGDAGGIDHQIVLEVVVDVGVEVIFEVALTAAVFLLDEFQRGLVVESGSGS